MRWYHFVFLSAWAVALTPCVSLAQGGTESPFDFTVGPQVDGGFGATLAGDRLYPLGPAATPTSLTSRFVILDVDAGWSSSEDATNNASVSAKPGVAFSRIRTCTVAMPDGTTSQAPCTSGPWLHAFGDLRLRFGEFKAADSTGVEHINQTIIGGGVQLRMTAFPDFYRSVLRSLGTDTGREDEVPSLTFTYYHVIDSSSEAAIPEDITADVLQGVARADLTLPVFCTTREVPAGRVEPAGREYSCPLGFQAKLTGTLPTGDRPAEFFYDVGVYLNSDGKIKPVIRLRSGEEHGHDYDQQLNVGLLWELGS